MATPGAPISPLVDKATGVLGTAASQLANSVAPIEIPSSGDLLSALAARLLTQREVNKAIRAHGIWLGSPPGRPPTLDDDTAAWLAKLWDVTLDQRYQLPTIDQLMQLYWRGYLGSGDWQSALKRSAVHPDWLAAWDELAKQIPGPADLITFLVRDVWAPDIIKTFGYDQEYPAQLEQWLGAQGLVYTIPSPIHDAAGLGPFNWAKAYWWSHWQLPSAGQGIQMMQRLRPSLRDPAVPRDPSGLLFTPDDLRLLLKTADYPTFWRDRLAALGYAPVGIRNLRALWATGLVDETDVTEIFLDQGYNLRDSRLQAQLIAQERREQLIAAQRTQTVRQVVANYTLGLSDRDFASQRVYANLLRTQAELAQFDAMPQAQQVATANGDRLTQMLLGNADLIIGQKRLARMLVLLKRAFVRGTLTEQQIRDQLQALGVIAIRRDTYVAEWQLEIIATRKQASAAQLVRWVGQGLLSVDAARDRMALLGYDVGTVDQLLIDGVLAQAGRNVRAVQATARGVRAEQTYLAQQARAALQIAAAAERQLARSANPARLARWYKDGLIPAPTFLARIVALGISPADAATWKAEIDHDMAAKKPPAPPKPAPPVNQVGAKLRQPPVATVGGWYKKGIIQKPEFETRLAEMGFTPEAIAKYEEQYAPS